MLRIGQSQVRFEDDVLVRGKATYTDDVRRPGELALVLLRSPVAVGRIARLDVSGAVGMPGVVAVFTGQELAAGGVVGLAPRVPMPGPDGEASRHPPFMPLAVDEVRHVGEPVAAILAETRAQAEDAAEAVMLEIEDRPAVISALEAARPDAPRVWPQYPDNLCYRQIQGDPEAAREAISGAAHVLRERLEITRITTAAMEPRAVLVSFDPETERFEVELGTQAPHRLGGDLAAALGLPNQAVHVMTRSCGGSFGMRNMAYPEYVVALWAARRLGRPVRWVAGRMESFQSDAHAREQWADATLALDEDGRFLAIDVAVKASLGAYLGPATMVPPIANTGGIVGVYRFPAAAMRIESYFTNTQINAPYRGAGRPEASYILEHMIDRAAVKLGVDRVELRRRNMVTPDQMPYDTGFIYTYDSGDFPAVLEKALAAADWAGFPVRRAEAEARGRILGIGLACVIEIANGPPGKPAPEFARLVVSPQAGARMLMGSSDSGQGHLTTFRQVLSDRLGLEPEEISLLTGDTDVVPQGVGTFGSRTMAAAGTSLWRAADQVIEALREEAAEMLEAASADIEFDHGRYRVAGTDLGVAFRDVLARADREVSGESFEAADAATFPNGCHVCEVEIDPDTGGTRVVRYTLVDDVGTVINPLLMKGQIIGGIAQGLGQALLEQVHFESGSGQLLSASFMDYAMPRAGDMPSPRVETHSVPTANNPLGAKGAGEAGTVGALPVVMSAVCDALASRGVGPIGMPASPLRVWQALNGANG
ncbi:xanthine dehydrogenase family protein molybdopterin-binding subunit [Alkalilacustris brevis]|uniref:xanthine dehydrogenase family protein molybdopterin-binding subunit n=1 Tax=Alkalilacustris brevis TaxID=2026338 RepID=UPI000E0D4BA9|nr:xanthine dehydrogenase family protein molybdopterin-binding subunit [Alkalilacustris brevis]